MGDGMSERPAEASTAVLAVDTGGTFTDFLLLVDGRLTALKLPSTPADPAEAVLDGVRRLAAGLRFELVHGSTVATNALLERKGARVILITNRGFEDVIEIGRQDRPQLYALVGHRDPPLVRREDRIGITGRIGADGSTVEAVSLEEMAGLAGRVGACAGEAVAVSLLHSYLDPGGERTVRDALSDTGLPVSLSSDILPEFREYERTSTTVMNAYIQPRMSRYLSRLEGESGAERVRIMASNGGSLTAADAAEEPVHTVVSGPAGGVVGAAHWARTAGFEQAITFDMGGTSTDVSVVPGRMLTTRELSIGGQPVAIQVLDIHTVGAGGGSIARVDAGGALRVGPRSAGAIPGPICYGLGGTELTVTDAHVWLGRIPLDALPEEGRALDREAIRGPLTALAEALDASLEGAAEGILEVADAAMERAIRVISVERGYDPIEFVLVAFGGAGGLHAASLAERIGASRALIPPHPGLLSAYGMLVAPIRREVSRTVLVSSDDPGAKGQLDAAFASLRRDARDRISTAVSDPDAVELIETIDARYRGQSFELAVPAASWIGSFHAEHETRYGYRRTDSPVEAVTLRTAAIAPGARVDPVPVPTDRATPTPAPIVVVVDGESIRAGSIDRDLLPGGATMSGPLVVTGYGSTCWVPPGWEMRVDPVGCLLLSRNHQ